MDTVLRDRGREICGDPVAFIQKRVADTPHTRQRALSFKVCEAWDWRQPNGKPCDVLCRRLLVQRHHAGHVQLPDPQERTARPHRHPVVEHIVLGDPLVRDDRERLCAVAPDRTP